MKPLFLQSFITLLSSVIILNLNSGCSDKMNVLLVTGGHSFDTTEFFSLFSSFQGISVDTISQPRANKLLEEMNKSEYKVIVFYDMWQDITVNQKEAFYKLLENGTGMVFLHHSLVSYQNWDEFINITGGKYWQSGYGIDSSKFSGYQHDLNLQVNVLDQDHPVTKDIQNFQILDEGYSNIEMLPSVIPLLETNDPSCARYVAWINEYSNSRIIYIMLGHDRKAYENEAFRILVKNAIIWASHPSSF
jgi:type 1 glutamine amidotransferase